MNKYIVGAIVAMNLAAIGCTNGPGRERYGCVFRDPDFGDEIVLGTVCARNSFFATIKCGCFTLGPDCGSSLVEDDCTTPPDVIVAPITEETVAPLSHIPSPEEVEPDDAYVMVDRSSRFSFTITEGDARIDDEDGNSTFFPIGGRIYLDGDLCPGCDVTLGGFELHPVDPQITLPDGRVARDVLINSMSHPTVAIVPDGNGFIFPTATIGFNVRALVDDDRQVLRAANRDRLPVILDTSAGTLTTNIELSDEAGNRAVIQFDAQLDNRRPVQVATTEVINACPGEVRLDASESFDPDGDSLRHAWYRRTGDEEDPFERLGAGAILTAELGEGTHELQLVTADSNSVASTDVTVVVEDTEGPQFTQLPSDPICIWPPQHKLVRFDLGKNLQIDARDDCDGDDVEVRIVDVRSSQPTDSIGDGSTSPDVLFGDQGFCVRAERQGPELAGRTYSVEVEAADGAGNVSSTTLEVHVPHDQGGLRSCDSVAAPQLVDGVEACDFSAPAASSSLCSLGAPGSMPRLPAALAVLIAVMLVARRRRTGCGR